MNKTSEIRPRSLAWSYTITLITASYKGFVYLIKKIPEAKSPLSYIVVVVKPERLDESKQLGNFLSKEDCVNLALSHAQQNL